MSDNNIAKDTLAETGTLASIFADPESLDEISEILDPTDFYETANEIIYALMLRLREEGKDIHPIGVISELKRNNDFANVGGIMYITELTNPVSLAGYATDALGYATIVKEQSRLRSIQKLGEQITNLATPGNGYDADQAIALAEKGVFDLNNQKGKKDEIANISSLFKDAIEQIEDAANNPEGTTTGVPSGFIDLDKKTSGFFPGQVVIVAARPAMGKALALDTEVPTPNGWTTMGEIKVGDKVFDRYGFPTDVVAVTETMVDRKVYELTFGETTVVADAEHLWPFIIDGEYTLISSEKLFELWGTYQNIFVPRVAPVRYSNASLLDAPPSQALTLAETFVSSKDAIGSTAILESVLLAPRKVRQTFVGRILENSFSSVNFDIYEVAFPQHIPALKELFSSLGIVYKVAQPEKDNFYFNIGRLPENTVPNSYVYKTLTSIKEIDSVPVRCIQVDNAESVYLVTREFIPTHNSTIAVDFARHASVLAGKTVLMFSLEMSRQELMQRIISAQSRVDMAKLKTGSLDAAEWRLVKETKEEIENANFLIDDNPQLNIGRLRSVIMKQSMRPEGLDLVVIDYLQLMDASSARKTATRENEVSELSRGIKILAKEFHVPIIALSQLNRGSEGRADKTPAVSDLRESGSLEQDADMVLLLHRPEVYDENDRPGEADLIIGKQRNGPTGRIPLIPMLNISKFANGDGLIPSGVVINPEDEDTPF